MNQQQAEERIKELKDYYAHVGSFVAVNLFLFFLNMFTDPSNIWFVWPLFGWGVGLVIHTFTTFFGGKDWEMRKLQELTGLSETQDELARLSERTDNLVKILSSVNWEKIDPELLETKQNLEDARQRIVHLQQEGNERSQQEVSEQIEKLEEFVTSSKFDYYELAAQDKK